MACQADLGWGLRGLGGAGHVTKHHELEARDAAAVGFRYCAMGRRRYCCSRWMATHAIIFLPILIGSTRQYIMKGVPSFL